MYCNTLPSLCRSETLLFYCSSCTRRSLSSGNQVFEMISSNIDTPSSRNTQQMKSLSLSTSTFTKMDGLSTLVALMVPARQPNIFLFSRIWSKLSSVQMKYLILKETLLMTDLICFLPPSQRTSSLCLVLFLAAPITVYGVRQTQASSFFHICPLS